MRKRNFYPCMGCWMGYGKCLKPKIPRKSKKKLVNFLSSIYLFNSIGNNWETCSIDHTYNLCKKHFHLTTSFFKYKKVLLLIKKAVDEDLNEILLNEDMRLCWVWEDDNGLYSYSGHMPFAYSDEEAGKTWAYSEMHSLICSITNGAVKELPKHIKSDIDLFKFIQSYKSPKEYQYDDE